MDTNVNDLLGTDFDDYLHSQVSEYAEQSSKPEKLEPPKTAESTLTHVMRLLKSVLRGAGGAGSGWTAENGHVPGSQGGISREDATSLLKDTLTVAGDSAKAWASGWAFNFSGKEQLIESFQPNLKEVHAKLESVLGKTFNVYRAVNVADKGEGIQSWTLSRKAAEDFLGNSYRGVSDTIRVGRVEVSSVLAIGSTLSNELLIDSANVKGSK
jgi:hypothetical protein